MGVNSNFANKTKRIFLAEPFTQKGLDNLSKISLNLTKEDFFDKKIYIEPFTEYCKTRSQNQNENEEQNKVLAEAYNGIPSYSEAVSLNAMKIVKDNFENKIADLDSWLFLIKGVAGSGKTTYLNYLEHSFSDEIIFHIFNFEETKQSISFMSRTFDLESLYANNVCKVISLLLIEVARAC